MALGGLQRQEDRKFPPCHLYNVVVIESVNRRQNVEISAIDKLFNQVKYNHIFHLTYFLLIYY